MTSTRFIMSITRLSSSPYRISQISNAKVFQHRRLITSWENQNLGYRYNSSFYKRLQYNNVHMRNFRVYNSFPSGAPLPPQPPSNNFLSWILGISLTLVLPFITHKWGPLLKIKNEVDTAVETIEEIAEVVEKVAEVVDKAAENVSDQLPADGKLKKVVELVENVAEETIKDADIVENAIDKFQEVEEEVENIVETLSPEAKDLHHKEVKDVKSS